MTTALLLIDLQNDYFPGGVLPLHQAEETESRIVPAITRAREQGDRVILVKHVSKADSGLFSHTGTGHEIRPAILGAAGDAPVVVKQFADAFQDTDLLSHLNGITEILVCGMMTQNCVVFTAISDAAKEFDVTVVGDLCAAPLDVVHRIALNALGSRLRVIEAAEI